MFSVKGKMSLLIRYRTLSRNPGFRGIWLDQSVQHGTPDLGGHGFKSHVGHGASLKERKKGREGRKEGKKKKRNPGFMSGCLFLQIPESTAKCCYLYTNPLPKGALDTLFKH